MNSVSILVMCLAFIAGIVAVLQIKRKNAWVMIVLYWVVLTIKNLWEWWGIS